MPGMGAPRQQQDQLLRNRTRSYTAILREHFERDRPNASRMQALFAPSFSFIE
jgi:hypothetical protein